MPDVEGFSSGRPSQPEPDAALAGGIGIGTVIAGKYRVERAIGKGGMGVVVAASQLALDRTVAIKLIRSEFAEDALAVERLLREAKAAASITSEHVAKVLDVGTLEGGAPFIVMEYLEGSDLQTLLERDGPLPLADAVDFVMQACEALAEAHRNGIVHRDIKPANIFIARLPGGRSSVKVVDFGISKAIGLSAIEPLTQPSSVVGSLYHMAPEQMRGQAVDARTDVWALGVLVFEMITGRKPFHDNAWPAVCAQVLSDGAPVLSEPVAGLSDDLRGVIQKCLRRLPDDRYGNVAELAVALSRFGSRKAHASLERIVLLATSTGSLSAHSLAVPEPPAKPVLDSRGALDHTRPVPPREFSVASATPSGAASRVNTGTPLPMTSSRPPATIPRAWLAIGAALAVSSLIGLVVFWVWPGSSPPPATEQTAPTSPLESEPGGGAAASPVVPAAVGVRPIPSEPSTPTPPAAAPLPAEGAASVAPRTSTARPTTALPTTALPTTSLPSSDSRAPGAPASPARGTPIEPRSPASGAPPAELPGPPAAVTTPSDAAGRPTEKPRDDPQAPTDVVAEPPRAMPARPKPPSAWDLGDITFEDDGKR
jgi:serine/threonine protein kinase